MDRDANDLEDIKLMDQGMTTMVMDSADLADMKKQDQGNHECEVLAEGSEGAREWEKCTKNPGHIGYIPAPEFSIDHLPEICRNHQVYEYIRSLNDLTVKIKVMCVSADRPDGYPFSMFKGRNIPHIGSGIVRIADLRHERKVLTKTCPCSSCEKPGNPEEIWWDCVVITAKYVVFNTEEARKTVIELSYDHENRDTVKYLYGVSVIDENTYGDRCEFRCVTHDAKVAELIRKAENMSRTMREIFGMMYIPTLSKEEAHLCVVVSHPHGRSKHVTFGHWKECLNQRDVSVRDSPLLWHKTYEPYTYDTPTCPGSSGGCTIILSLRESCWTNSDFNYICHTHSSGNILNGQNVNTSSYWPKGSLERPVDSL